MVDKIIILQDLKKLLQKKYAKAIHQVILFGSQAKGTATENSDYDILILLNNEYSQQDENTILDLCYDIDLKYNILIDAHLLSVKELSGLRGKQPIFTNAINSGIYA
jgi:predicted nucleotidyltransferase